MKGNVVAVSPRSPFQSTLRTGVVRLSFDFAFVVRKPWAIPDPMVEM